MDYFAKEENGTWCIPWEHLMDSEHVQQLEIVERLRFIDLRGIVVPDPYGMMPVWETARYDDDRLMLNAHDSYPVILRFQFRPTRGPQEWEWYAVHHRGNGHLCFDRLTCFWSANEREGFCEPVLWG